MLTGFLLGICCSIVVVVTALGILMKTEIPKRQAQNSKFEKELFERLNDLKE